MMQQLSIQLFQFYAQDRIVFVNTLAIKYFLSSKVVGINSDLVDDNRGIPYLPFILLQFPLLCFLSYFELSLHLDAQVIWKNTKYIPTTTLTMAQGKLSFHKSVYVYKQKVIIKVDSFWTKKNIQTNFPVCDKTLVRGSLPYHLRELHGRVLVSNW